MRAGVAYLLAHVFVSVLGLPIAMIPEVRSWQLPARIASAFAVGAVVLAAEATLFTLLGVAWSTVMLLVPSAILALFVAWRNWRHRPAASIFRPGGTAATFAVLAGGIAFVHLALSLATTRATSVDFLLSWGVKAVRFAAAGAVDPGLLRWPYFGHSQPFYPPLVPVLDAWGVLAAGRMPWRVAPLATLLWFGAALLLFLETMRRRLGDCEATVVTAFWAAAMGASLAFSFSGANAEAPLLLYETVGGVLLLTEREQPLASRRFLTGVFLAGAVLTKAEGFVGVALLICGAAIRDLVSSKRPRARDFLPLALPPLIAGLLWFGFVLRFGIPLGYPGRGAILEFHSDHIGQVVVSMVQNLQAGTYWLSWAFPFLLLLTGASFRQLKQVVPGVVAIVGLFAFFLWVYLHEPGDPSLRIGWEIPRISQPALSLLIALTGLCTLGQNRRLLSRPS